MKTTNTTPNIITYNSHISRTDDLGFWSKVLGLSVRRLRRITETAIRTRHHEAIIEHPSHKAHGRQPDIYTLYIGPRSLRVVYTVERHAVMIRGFGWDIIGREPLDDRDGGWFYHDNDWFDCPSGQSTPTGSFPTNELMRSGQLFPLGHLIFTPAVVKRVNGFESTIALERHMSGDWGYGDFAHNGDAMNRHGDGAYLDSIYLTKRDKEFHVYTAGDRMETIVMLCTDRSPELTPELFGIPLPSCPMK